MATNIEIEAKCLITKEEYNKVITFYKADKYKRIKQINHYIDTNDFALKNAGIGLRIREKDDFVMTLKAPLAEGLLEKNESITWKAYEDYRDNDIFPECSIKEVIEMLNIDPKKLEIQASLETERIEIPNFENKGLFSIDKNTYNGIVDYELELEGNSINIAKENLKSICDEVGIHYIDNLKNKQARALETIK
ncbi:MAG: CYTH domain-containing protein [Bacilli bacterium]